MWIPGSLTTQIQQQELAAISNFRRGSNTKAVMLAAKWAKDFDTLEDYTAFYDDVAGLIEKPLAADNSDVAFGAQRLAIKGFIMRAVKTDEFLKKPHHQSKKWIAQQDLSLKDEQLAQVCGAGVTRAKIREQNKLFVSEYDQVSQYNDPKQPQKYVADVLGFFCFNSDKQQLLPVEIRVLQTGLAYTPFDTEEEWTLAKMALEAAEISYQNMQHMAETHAMTIPIRVEAYRTMSDEHPVFALLMRHVYADFALEALSAKMLLNVSTEVDKTFGWGASGAIRFLDNQMKERQGVRLARQRLPHGHQAPWPRSTSQRTSTSRTARCTGMRLSTLSRSTCTRTTRRRRCWSATSSCRTGPRLVPRCRTCVGSPPSSSRATSCARSWCT
ncbi:hypothetical protein PINS_up021908 [Pythium insidiosum]|nr:hypothetical protein PINS_up021908 [Pythium insidiosum]